MSRSGYGEQARFALRSLKKYEDRFDIHIINTNIVVLFYPYNLTITKVWCFIIGWEILENLIIPNINENFYYFKEDIRDTTGDLIAPLPAILLLYNLNSKYKNKNDNFLKFNI